jgi:hypothetical protein
MKTDDLIALFYRTDGDRFREQRDAREMARITRRTCLVMTGGLALIAGPSWATDSPIAPPLYVAKRTNAPGRVYIFGSAITTDHS